MSAKVEILRRGAFGAALVHLEAGDSFVSESGAMFRMSPNIDVDVTTKTKGKGGILAGLKRLVAGDNFFFSTYRAENGPGEVGLAPTLQGEVGVLELDGSTSWLCAGGSYLASSPDITVDTQFQGFKGFFSGESLFFLKATGTGPLLVNAFGRITQMMVREEIIIDTGHVVAFEESLTYEITKAGGSWIQSWLSGEGFVMKFSGQGRVLVQSHNPTEFGKTIGPRLPERR